MIKNFNFYDVYGFFLPGFVLIALLWLPFGFIDKTWPEAEFSSALAAVIFGYVVGHVLQTIAHYAIPSTVATADGKLRYPSNVFLDNDDNTFSVEFKKRLANQIKKEFDIDVGEGSTDATRRDAFFLCRSALIKSKTVIYAEQFEGMYALMRGLCTACALAVAYYFGWAISGMLQPIKKIALNIAIASSGYSPAAKVNLTVSSLSWSGLAIGGGLLLACLSSLAFRQDQKEDSKWLMISFLILTLFSTGYYLGLVRITTAGQRGFFVAAAMASLFVSHRCFAGYKAFANEFAKAVYRDFSNYEKRSDQQQAHQNPPHQQEDD